MSPFIHTLNFFGQQAGDFAGPMLLQSSLLIALVFCLDLALRRKLRASARYVLWLVVLVKLVLPPSLAIPTGLGYWLRSASPAENAPSTFAVSYGVAEGSSIEAQAAVGLPISAPESISSAGWALVGWGAISLGLLGWLIARWRQVARKIEEAVPANESMNQLMEEARILSGLRRSVELRITEEAMSPAVCGILKPVILLPRSLAETLSPHQLRAVLLHELIHLGRGDLWVNVAQALLQIVYWWNPLLWLANARMRHVREEAVDDGVMVALAKDADSYAPTLVAVAKQAFDRPLASLGLIGILESRSTLRRRIERLVNCQRPCKTGVTILSVMGIAVFGAIAVPMGEAPSANKQAEASAKVQAAESPATNGVFAGVNEKIEELNQSDAASKNSAQTNNSPTQPVSVATNVTPANRPKIKIQTQVIELENFDSSSEAPDSPLRVLSTAWASEPTKQIEVTPEMRARLHLPETARLTASSNETFRFTRLTEEQTQALLKRCKERANTSIVSLPPLEGTSGGRGRVAMQDSMPPMIASMRIMTGVNTNAEVNRKPDQPVGHLQSADIQVGPVLDISLTLEPDRRITLKIESSILEFAGFDKPEKKDMITMKSEDGKVVTVMPAVPRLRIHESSLLVTVAGGQTLLLGGLVSENIQKVKDRVPVLGSIPLVGRLFRSESSIVTKKQMFFLVTPTIEDSPKNPGL